MASLQKRFFPRAVPVDRATVISWNHGRCFNVSSPMSCLNSINNLCIRKRSGRDRIGELAAWQDRLPEAPNGEWKPELQVVHVVKLLSCSTCSSLPGGMGLFLCFPFRVLSTILLIVVRVVTFATSPQPPRPFEFAAFAGVWA